MKYRIFSEGGDTLIFCAYGKSPYTQSLTFNFTGFSNSLHPFYKGQLAWIKAILSSAGILLNLSIVPTVDDIGNPDKGVYEPGDIKIPDTADVSTDNNIYYLIMDEEMGRGWAVLIKEADGEQVIITQEHRDSVIGELMDGDFIRGFGIDYACIQIDHFDNIPSHL